MDEWLLPDMDDSPTPPAGYAVSFIHFHKQGFTSPVHRFLRRHLYYYKVDLQHLNPNGIQHLTAFVVLCEGYLGIGPDFDLWRYFFTVTLQRTKGKGRQVDRHWLMGCAGIHLRNNRVGKYMTLKLVTSNKGWHSHWFYLKNCTAAPCQRIPEAES
jgi:hypothetical protein